MTAPVPLEPGARLLLVRLSALGDILMSLEALALLRAGFPGARLEMAVQDEFAPLLEGHPHLDAVVPVPVRHWRGLAKNPVLWPRLLRELAAFRARMKPRGYAWAVDVHGNTKSGLVTWLSGAPRRAGPAPGEDREVGRWFWTHRAPRPPSPRRHRRARARSVVQALGLDPDAPARAATPAYDTAWADAALADALPGWTPEAGAAVVLHPGASPKAAFKRWPADRFGALASALGHDQVVVVAGPGEEGLVEAACASSGGALRPLPTPPSLPALGGLLRRAAVFVGADSGPAQLADACGTPSVVLFGPKDPALYGPSRGVSIRRGVPCGPCGKRRCPLARVECMEDLTPASVARVVRAVLEGRVPRGVRFEGGTRVVVEAHG